MSTGKIGLYVSYNEHENGPLMRRSPSRIPWLCDVARSRSRRPENLQFPTEIIIRISGSERYTRGILLSVASADTLGDDFAPGRRNTAPRLGGQRTAKVSVSSPRCFYQRLEAS